MCNRIFSNEIALNGHIKNLSKLDDHHSQFFTQVIDFLDFGDDDSNQEPKSDQPIFRTPNQIKYSNDRFILKSKNPEDQKKYRNLISRKKNTNNNNN